MSIPQLQRITLYVMLAVGLVFWLATIVIPGFNWPFLLLSAVLVAYCVFELMRLAEEDEDG